MSLKNKNNEYILDIINYTINTCPDILIENAEQIYYAQLVHAALSGGKKRVFLVSGPSASGKTTTAEKLKEALLRMKRQATVVSMDDFYKHRHELPIIDGKPNAEVPESLEIAKLTQVIEDILKKGKALLPSYDFIAGIRSDDVSEVNIEQNGVMIIEGLHALNPEIQKGIDSELVHKIYVSPHSGFALENKKVLTKRDLRFIRRLVRDSWSRGSDAQRTFDMWGDVCHCEDQYIRPLSENADSTIDTTHAYELALIRPIAEKLLSSIGKESKYYEKSRALIKNLSYITPLDLSYLPKNSLLNEFINVKAD